MERPEPRHRADPLSDPKEKPGERSPGFFRPGWSFGLLRQFDGFSNEETATGDMVRALITKAEDIRL